MKKTYRGRIAPTPSGFLHKGHARTFRIAWQRARDSKGKLVFRMDDLDKKRCSEEYKVACLADCKGIGLDWDEGPDIGGIYGPYNQSERSSTYLEVLKELKKRGCIYPCEKSRSEIRAERLISTRGEFLFPSSLRPSLNHSKEVPDFPGNVNWRFRVAQRTEVKISDQRSGLRLFREGVDFSDFLVWRKDGLAAYELATVADDHHMEISEIVRGEDLEVSSARQCMVYDAMGWDRPKFYHCRLITGPDGKKLSKSTRSLPRLFSTS